MSTHAAENNTPAIGWPATRIREALPVGAQAKLARRHRVTSALISKVAARTARSLRIEEAIARVIGVPREEIFGAYRRPGGPRKDEAAA